MWVSVVFVWQSAAQISMIDRRKSDEIIFMDVSGSIVHDVRVALKEARLADYRLQPNGGTEVWKLRKGVDLVKALNSPKVYPVVTNNLLYKAIQYVETMIDQQGFRNIYLSMFDDGPRTLGAQGVPLAQPGAAIFGPFALDASDPSPDSAMRQRLKRFLSPGRYGPYELAPGWRGVFAEAVLQGDGPTAIHGTCVAGLDFLKRLMVPGYTNATRQQRMILFTDGEETRDKRIPFSTTISYFRLHQRGMPFEFSQVFIQSDDSPLPPAIRDIEKLLLENGFPAVKRFDGNIRVDLAANGDVLKGDVGEPDRPTGAVNVRLSPAVTGSVTSGGRIPLQGKLRFRVKGVHLIPGLDVNIVPSEVSLDQLSRPISFQLTLRGRYLSHLFQSGAKELDGLILHWDLIEDPVTEVRREGKPPIFLPGAPETSLAFSGKEWMKISLSLIPGARPVEVRCLQPSLGSLRSGQRIEIGRAPLAGTIGRFGLDFSKLSEAGAVRVELTELTSTRSILFASERTGPMILRYEKGDVTLQEFGIAVNARPGTSNAVAALKFLPEASRAVPTPNDIQVSIAFEPGVLSCRWRNLDGSEANCPSEIDFGVVHMAGAANGTASVVKPPTVTSVLMEVPSNAVTPVGEWRLTGTHASAFRIVQKAGSLSVPSRITESIELVVQAAFYSPPTRPTVQTRSNLTATLEFNPIGNFVSEMRRAAGSERERRVSIPLKMLAVIQPAE